MAKAELLVSLLLCVSAVYAADHVVGGKNGWMDILVDYTQWAAGQKFVAGDKLIFNYETIHDVVELDKDGFDTCVVPADTPSYTGGHTTINLTLPGSRYFICSISDHCSGGGMKLAITVEAGSTGGGGSTPPSPSPASTPPSDIPPSPSPPPPSDIPPAPSSPSIPPSDTTPSPSPGLVVPSDTPTPSPSSNPPSDLVPPTPSPSVLQPSDLPPTPPLETPPAPSAGTFGSLNPVLIGFSLILVTLFAFMG